MTIGVLPHPLGRRKTVEEALATTEEDSFRLRKDVGALDVIVFGVGVIIGAGIFVLTGVAAATEAGPAIVLSFLVAGLVCALAALCYAEFAAMVPVAGSAYTFSYVPSASSSPSSSAGTSCSSSRSGRPRSRSAGPAT
jgi:amino acid permease